MCISKKEAGKTVYAEDAHVLDQLHYQPESFRAIKRLKVLSPDQDQRPYIRVKGESFAGVDSAVEIEAITKRLQEQILYAEVAANAQNDKGKGGLIILRISEKHYQKQVPKCIQYRKVFTSD